MTCNIDLLLELMAPPRRAVLCAGVGVGDLARAKVAVGPDTPAAETPEARAYWNSPRATRFAAAVGPARVAA